MVVLVRNRAGESEPVCVEVEGKIGIPIFDTVEDAEQFGEAYQELLGPGLEALELPDHAMAQLLVTCLDRIGYVILKPRPVRASGGSVWWEMVDIHRFAEGLSESDL